MRTKNTALATAIAISLATGGFVASNDAAWADTSTRTLQTVIDRTPADDGYIYIRAGETINVSLLGLNQTGIVDTLGEQYGAILFGAINTQKGEIFAGSDTPGERFQDVAPLRGDFSMVPPDKKPFNNLKYVRMVQGLGRAYIFYPPNINTPPIMDRTDDENREYDECCFLPCGEKIPEGVLNCPTEQERQDIVLDFVEDSVKVTLQERFANTVGGVEYKVIQSLEKKIRILPAIPRVSKLEIVDFQTGPRDNLKRGERQVAEEVAVDEVAVDNDVCLIDGKAVHAKNHGIRARMTAGVEGAKVTIWALKEIGAADRDLNDPNNCLGNRGLAKEDTANGRIVLKLVAVGSRTEYKRFPAVDMLNGEAQVVFPADVTMAGNYYLEAELYLAVNGDVDPNSDMALPNLTDNVDMFTADMMQIVDTGKPRKLKLGSTKKVISDDANPPQNTPFNPGAAWNAATQVTVKALDEYGNETVLPAGQATKVKVVDETNVLNSGSLNMDFAVDVNRRTAADYIGDNQGDVLRLGEASLIATIDGNPSIAASDPLKIKVVAKNLVAAPYVGSPIAGDTAYGDPAGVPAADAAYPSANRYLPNTVNVVKDIQAGNQIKAFSVGVDGGRTNGIPDGMFDFYHSPVDGAILPNLVDGANSDDDFVSRNSTTTMVIKTPAGEEVEAGVAQPVLDAAGNVVEIVQADGTRGQGARIDTLFTKPVPGGMGKYFVIGDKTGQYGETLVYLPGDIKPSAASKAKILNAHGFEDVVLGKDGKPVLDENGNPVIALDAQLDYPEPDGTHQLMIPQKAVKLGDEYGNPVSSAAAGTFTPGTSNGQPAIVTVNEYGEPVSLGARRAIRQAAGNLVPGGDAGNGNTNAYLLSYNSEEFAGTDRVSFGFTSPGVKPRTVEITIPQKPELTTVKTEVEQTTLPVNSEIAITIRTLDQHGLPIDGLGNTTVSFTGNILKTATVWRMEDERRDLVTGNLLGIDPLSSGDVVRPGGGDQQVLVMNIGNKEGEFTINFNSPELPAGSPAQSITFKAVAVYTPPQVCSTTAPDLCKDEESCTSAGGEWADNKCAFTAVDPSTKEACEDQGGVFATNKCFPVVGKDGKPSGLVSGLEAASSVDGGQYGDEPAKENAGFFGGVMITGTQGTGDRKTDKFENNASTLLGDNVQLSGVIKVEDIDKGKKADIVVGGFHIYQGYPDGFTWYMMVNCSGNDFVTIPSCPSFGWQIKMWPYDPMGFPILSELEPLKSMTFNGVPGDGKDEYVTVDMFKGNFSLPADPAMQIYFGYIVTEGDNRGKVVYSGKPIEVKIEAKAAKDTAKDTEKDAKDTEKDAKDTKTDAKDTKADAKDTKADAKDTKADAKDTKADAKDTGK